VATRAGGNVGGGRSSRVGRFGRGGRVRCELIFEVGDLGVLGGATFGWLWGGAVGVGAAGCAAQKGSSVGS